MNGSKSRVTYVFCSPVDGARVIDGTRGKFILSFSCYSEDDVDTKSNQSGVKAESWNIDETSGYKMIVKFSKTLMRRLLRYSPILIDL